MQKPLAGVPERSRPEFRTPPFAKGDEYGYYTRQKVVFQLISDRKGYFGTQCSILPFFRAGFG